MGAPAITVLKSLADLQAQLERLGLRAGDGPTAGLFGSPAWLQTLAASGFDGVTSAACTASVWLARAPETGDWVGLPLCLDPGRAGSLSNYYSSLYLPLSAADARPQAWPPLWQALAQALRRHPARWPVLRFEPLARPSVFFEQWQHALRNAGYQLGTYFCFGNWYLAVDGRSFAAYEAGLPSALRHSIARGQRRLSRQGRWEISLQRQDDAGLAGAVADFVAVYDASWKGAEPNPAFIPALARMAAQQGWLRLGVLRLDGLAVAAQLWLVCAGQALIFKLAYRQGFERFSAGSVLTHALMRQVIDEDRVQEVDYLTGDDAYKRDWMSHRRERWGLAAFDLRTPAGCWAAARHALGTWRASRRHAP